MNDYPSKGNNGGSYKHNPKDSKQSKNTLARGRAIGQKLLKSTIYNKKMNYTEITINIYTYKLNEIPGIMDEIIRCVVIDAPTIKRICFETGYGKPKKAIEIRKCASLRNFYDFFLIFDAQTITHTQPKYSQFLMQTLGYSADKGGAPKTFKVL